MPVSPQLQEYFDFLEWFQQAYPGLNAQYWPYITIPEKGKGVGVIEKDLDEAIVAVLKQIQNEYYNAGGKQSLG